MSGAVSHHCPDCELPISEAHSAIVARVVGGFLTTEQVERIAATLAHPNGIRAVDELCRPCLVGRMADSV